MFVCVCVHMVPLIDFKCSTPGFKAEFFFAIIGCLSNSKEQRLSNILPMAAGEQLIYDFYTEH